MARKPAAAADAAPVTAERHGTPTLIERLSGIASGQESVPAGTVSDLADEWVESIGERATPGCKEDVAAALRAKHELARANALMVIVQRVGE